MPNFIKIEVRLIFETKLSLTGGKKLLFLNFKSTIEISVFEPVRNKRGVVWCGLVSFQDFLMFYYVLKRKQNRTKAVCSWMNMTHSTPTYSLIKNITLCKRGAFKKHLQISTVFNSIHCSCCNGYVSQEGGKEFIPHVSCRSSGGHRCNSLFEGFGIVSTLCYDLIWPCLYFTCLY